MDLTLTELSQASLRNSPTVNPARRGSGPPGFPVTSVSLSQSPVTGDLKQTPGPSSYPAHLKFSSGLLSVSID